RPPRADPGGLGGRGPDVGGHGTTRATGRRWGLLGADGAGRPVHRTAARAALASVGDDVVGPGVAARTDGAARAGHQADRRVVRRTVLHGRTAGSPTASESVVRVARWDRGRCCRVVTRTAVATAPLGTAIAAGPRGRPARRGDGAGAGRPRRIEFACTSAAFGFLK